MRGQVPTFPCHFPPSPHPFFPEFGASPNPCWHDPHLPHPWVQPQTLLPGQFWGFFSTFLCPKFKELDDALSPEPLFLSKIPSPCHSWSQIWVVFFPKQASVTAQNWILGCYGAVVATPGQRFWGPPLNILLPPIFCPNAWPVLSHLA